MVRMFLVVFFFFKPKTAYALRISDWISDVCSADLRAAIVTGICIVLGYPVAAFIARQARWKTFFLLLVIFPWLVSVVVRTFAWIVLLGPNGFVNNFLIWADVIERPLRMMFNFQGVATGMVHVLLPFMIISILAVFSQLPRSLSEAAMSLGARPMTVFFKVTLPLTVHGVISGAIIVYLGCVGAVVTPLLLGGLTEKMIGTQIYTDMFLFFDFGKTSRSEEHTSELQSLMRISYAVFCLKKKHNNTRMTKTSQRI